MPPKKVPDVDVDGRGQKYRDTSSSRSAASQMGDRSMSLPSVMGASPGAASPVNIFKTPPSRTGLARTESPPTSATARVSPAPPSNRQPAVPIRPPAFRPVPIQAPGSTGPPSRSQVIRAATAAVRHAAPGQRATGSQPMRPVAMSTRETNIQASPVVPLAAKIITPPNVRSAAPNAPKNTTYARVAQTGAPAVCVPSKSASNVPSQTSIPSSVENLSAPKKKVNKPKAKINSDLRRAASPLSRHRLAGAVSAAADGFRSAAKTLFMSPPRGSAQDSPAMMSACSSRQGSDMSTTSERSRVDRRDMSPDMSVRAGTRGEYQTPNNTTDALRFDYEVELDVAARPQRRRRSPDEEDEEEAKRHCVKTPLPQRTTRGGGGSISPTHYATEGRRNSEPTPKSSEPVAYTDRVSVPFSTDVNNRSNDGATQPASAAAQQKKTKSPRYPPLIVEKLPNWAAHFRAVREKLGHPPNARPYQNGIRFLPESAEEYRVVQRYLTDLEKESGLSWFAYSLPAERSVKLAIRGLPADTEVEEIEEELRLHGYEPEYVRHIKARGERPGCIFHAVIKRTPDFRKIYDTTTFLYMRGVKIEAWRGKKGPAQCHRCQKFRHSSHLCHRPLACVRCGENHAARDCPRPKTEPATCANCAGAHPASNSRCPVYIQEAKNRRAGTVAITRQQRKTNDATDRPANVEETEAPSESLMAAANGPTSRQEAPSGRRRKNMRGGKKGKQPQPPTSEETQESGATKNTTNMAQVAAQTAPVAAETKPRGQRQRNQGRALQSAKAEIAQATAPTTQTKKASVAATNQQRQTSTMMDTNNIPINKPRREFTACAIKLLMDLIKAIRQGQDVELVILDGLAELLQMYHG